MTTASKTDTKALVTEVHNLGLSAIRLKHHALASRGRRTIGAIVKDRSGIGMSRHRQNGRSATDLLSAQLQLQQQKQLSAWRVSNLNRLTGVTAFYVDELGTNGFGIRFEMAVEGHYQDPHYVFISKLGSTIGGISSRANGVSATAMDAQKPWKRPLCVYRHTLPDAICIGSIAEKYLNSDLLLFASHIERVLRDMCFRHSIVLRLRTHPEVAHVEADSVFSTIIVSLRKKKFSGKYTGGTSSANDNGDNAGSWHELDSDSNVTLRCEEMRVVDSTVWSMVGPLESVAGKLDQL